MSSTRNSWTHARRRVEAPRPRATSRGLLDLLRDPTSRLRRELRSLGGSIEGGERPGELGNAGSEESSRGHGSLSRHHLPASTRHPRERRRHAARPKCYIQRSRPPPLASGPSAS